MTTAATELYWGSLPVMVPAMASFFRDRGNTDATLMLLTIADFVGMGLVIWNESAGKTWPVWTIRTVGVSVLLVNIAAGLVVGAHRAAESGRSAFWIFPWGLLGLLTPLGVFFAWKGLPKLDPEQVPSTMAPPTPSAGRLAAIARDTSCHHLLEWGGTGVPCSVCDQPLGEILSEQRGKHCKRCGFVIHHECEPLLNQARAATSSA